MLDKKEFRSIEKDLKKFEENRESVIRQSRGIIKLSKQIIYAIHRGDTKSAHSLFKDIKDKIRKLPKQDYDTGLRKVAVQEYVEAASYLIFVAERRIPTRKVLGVETEPYLLGLCDLTGELVRRAVNDVINKRLAEAREIKGLVEEIYGMFLKFDLRNGELRKKSDSIKYNLGKLEDIIYDIKVRGR
jgi:translin